MAQINRQWILSRRPKGRVKREDFEYREVPVPDAELKAGEILIRNMIFICAPTMRNWMDEARNNLYPSNPLGAPMLALSAGRVAKSADPRFPVGSRVTAYSSWQDYQILNADACGVKLMHKNLNFVEVMGVYGINAIAAYFGVKDVGRPQKGDTLVVTGAAGSVGSYAAQIGKIMGCRVIGIAGGPAKCEWLLNDCGLDAVVDYKSENVAARLAELCPNGINIFFDNVGGDMLQAGVDLMAKFGRIVLCGQIAAYNDGRPVQGPTNMMRLVYGSVTMQGFLQGDYTARHPQAIEEMIGWVKAGKLKHREDVRPGFNEIPENFNTLFSGENKGTLLVAIDDGIWDRE
jgi:NADPH-dependent curcumin reductase CurA